MSPLKVFTIILFLWNPSFARLSEQDKFNGLFDFRAMDSNSNTQTDDVFVDSKIMYDTLYDNVLNINFDETQNCISNEAKLQKIKTYHDFIKYLSTYKRRITKDSLQMAKTHGRSAQKRRTLTNTWSKHSNQRFLKSEEQNDWSILTKLFNPNS